MPETPPAFALHAHRHRLPDGRHLALDTVGPDDATDVLLCLPGLLETRRTFDPVLQAVQALAESRPHAHDTSPLPWQAISLDHCGRGDSDRLPDDAGYSMARYLDDVAHLLRDHVLRARPRRLHVLGTSMGGILGMYLASDAQWPLRSLCLNDIGLSFHWVSIYGLYDGMKQGLPAATPEAWATQLRVSPGVLRAVQSPAHFDLPYRKDWKGMKFAHLLQHYRGDVRLVRGGLSGVCLPEQVQALRQQVPHAHVLEVPTASHPVPYTPAVCEFVLADALACARRAPAHAAPAPEMAAPVPPTEPASAPTPPAMAKRGWWHWLRQKLG